MTRRQSRYNDLRSLGFTHFESTQYSKIPMYSDVMKYLVKTRHDDYVKAGSPSVNSTKWLQQLKFDYDVHGWEWNNSVGAWRQYRFYEALWHDRHPNAKDKWVSPTKHDSNKRYKALNRDLILQQKAKYRARNKDKIKTYAKDYRLRKRNVR